MLKFDENDALAYKALSKTQKTKLKKEFKKITNLPISGKTIQRFFNDSSNAPTVHHMLMKQLVFNAANSIIIECTNDIIHYSKKLKQAKQTKRLLQTYILEAL